MRLSVIIAAADGEIGRRSAVFSILLVSKTYSLYNPHDPTYLASGLMGNARSVFQKLGTYEITEPETIEDSKVSMYALSKLLCGERQEKCVKAALDILVAFDLYMRHHMGQERYRSPFGADDIHAFFNLRHAFMRAIAEVPELAMNSQLGTTLSVKAA